MTASVETARAGAREWIGLGVLALPCMLVSMDLTVLYLAVPAISAELKPSASQLLWITDIYGFLIAGSLITMGTLGDRIGRRRLLLMGAVAFGAASVLAAFSTSAVMLIAARAVLGIAGATLMPSTLSLIRNMFHDAGQRTSAIAVWTSSFTVGGMVGPLLGGAMLEHFWWGSVFLLAVPAMALLLALGPLLLPEFRDPGAERFDFVSAAMSLAAVLAVIFGIKRFAESGFAWLPALTMVVGAAIGVLFVRRQRRLVHPLIDLGLFAVPAFSAALATNTLSFFVMFGVFLFTAQYMQLVLGFSPLVAGLMTVPSSLAFMAGSMLTPAFVGQVGPGLAIACGLAVGAAGFIAFTFIDGSDRRISLPDRVRRLCRGSRPGLHRGDRPDRRHSTPGAGRRGVGDIGNRHRGRRRAGHRDPRQHRRRDLSRPHDLGCSRRRLKSIGRGRAAHARRRHCGGGSTA